MIQFQENAWTDRGQKGWIAKGWTDLILQDPSGYSQEFKKKEESLVLQWTGKAQKSYEYFFYAYIYYPAQVWSILLILCVV